MTGNWQGTEWEKWGQTDPYFGVLSHARFRRNLMGEAERAEFFATGEADIRSTFETLERFLGRDPRPRTALDFGCGVGRMTIPIARRAGRVTAVDVSPSMLEEARANCAGAGVDNVEFAPGLEVAGGPFEFVHSYIVFQHIPPEIGYRLLGDILSRLAPGGTGMLHVTYARNASRLARLAHRARRSSRIAHAALNVLQGRPVGAPLMAMFEYDLGRVMTLLREGGCYRVALQFTDHGGCEGAMIFFERPSESG